MKGKVSRKVVSKEVVKDSFTWKYERSSFRKSSIKRGMVLVKDSLTWKCERKGFRKSGLKRGLVLVRDSFP